MGKAEAAEHTDDERRLVDAAARGDRRAFRSLYDRYLGRVLAQIGRLLGPGAHVEDIAQDVFVRVFQSLPTFESRSSFRTWLFGITHHTAIDWLRREKRTIDLGALRLLDGDADSFARLEAREHLRILHAALDNLSVEAREAFVWHEFEGLSLREIAEMTQTPLFTIAARIRRAREALSSLVDAASHPKAGTGGRR